MKAAVNTKYGPPDVLEVKEVPKPVPKAHQVLIKVYATTVNRTDCGVLKADPFIVRFFSGLIKPKNTILGDEFAGRIEAVGSDVSSFKVGDKVFGYSDVHFGAHAQYMIMLEQGALATMPKNMTYKDVAPSTEGAHYALNYLRAFKLKKGQKILIYGATGAIGSAAVQLSNHIGADITAVCSTKHIPLVKSLGARRVIDYTKEDFTKIHDTFDVVFDAVGKSSFGKCKPLLKPRSVYVSTDLGPFWQNPLLALLTAKSKGKKVLFPIPKISKEDIIFLKKLMEKGKFKPVIDRYYSLRQIAEAYRYVDTGQKIGNVVITVAKE